ncbi:hypothetical protein GCM10028804_32460 [Larkinella terrae]
MVLQIVYLVTLALGAGVAGWLIDVAATNDRVGINPVHLILTVNGFVCGTWAFMEFFPAYQQRSKLVSSAFPIRFRELWLANVFYDIFTVSFVGTVIPYFILNVFSNTYTNLHLVCSLLLLGNVMVFVQLVKAFLESAHRKQVLFLISWLLLSLTIGFLVWHWRLQNTTLSGALTLGLVSQCTLLYFVDRATEEQKDTMSSVLRISILSPVYTAFINNAKARKAFAFGVLMKAIFLSLTGKTLTSEFLMTNLVFMLYVSPLILFTYVANNSWGFFPALWINRALGKRSEIYRMYLQLIALPLLIDLIVTIGVLIFLRRLNLEFALFYLIITLLLILNGLIFSLYKAFFVHNSLNFGQVKNNVNGWSILSAFILIILTALALKTVVTTLLLCFGLSAVVWYLFGRFLPGDKDLIYKTYESVFKNRG